MLKIGDYKKINIGKPIKEFSLDSIKFSHLVNTEYFGEAANDYLKNEKAGYPVYTREPFGSNAWWDYWLEQDRRCAEGFQVGDLWITGRHYFFRNFFRMMRTPPRDDKEKNRTSAQISKIESFPGFWAIQWLWFTFTNISRFGGSFLGIISQGGLDICAMKTRGAGFSYMDAADDVYNYNFIDDSKSYIMAAASTFLEGVDGIMPKIQTGLDFLNTGTGSVDINGKIVPGGYYYRKNRYDTSKEPMIFKAGYKDLDSGAILGSGSVIGAIICDNINKARGNRGMKITLEEGGSFPNLLSLEAVTKGLVIDGSGKTGSRSLFGTGGEIGDGIEGLETIFNNPKAFGFMGFPNIWEGEEDEVGFFCPSYLADAGIMDSNGNPNIEKHLITQEEIREAKKDISASIADKHVAEYPFVPSEAIKRVSGNPFPGPEIENRIKRIETKLTATNLVHGWLEYTDKGGLEFSPSKVCVPILNFPHDTTGKTKLDGAITIKQKPQLDANGKAYRDMYFIVVDNYGIDESASLTSLFAAYVWKFYNINDVSYARLPIAWYVARPTKQETAFENLMKLSMFYNAQVMGEYNAQGQQIIDYFTRKHKFDMLMDEPDKSGVEIQSRRKHKFMSIQTESKLSNITYLVQWCLEERFEEEGKVIRNIHETDDLGFLYEMKKFSMKKGGNYDRISANSLAPIILKQHEKNHIARVQGEVSLLTRETLFSDFHSNSVDNYAIAEY